MLRRSPEILLLSLVRLFGRRQLPVICSPVLLDSLQQLRAIVARATTLHAPQLGSPLLIVTISTSAGFFVGRIGARRSFLFLGFGFLATCTASLLVSRYLKIDILFAPMALGSTAAVFLVQLHRLWLIDTLLTRRVNETISRTDAQDVSIAENRLTSGLKLLQTILPLEEAFVFQPNEDGALVPCARLRAQARGSLQAGRNSVWRKLVQLCDKAATKHEIALAPIGEIDTLENVAMPLQHGGRTVGTLLLRLRESFDQSDRRLLAAVGGQLARDLQREDAQRKKLDSNLPAFISARTSGTACMLRSDQRRADRTADLVPRCWPRRQTATPSLPRRDNRVREPGDALGRALEQPRRAEDRSVGCLIDSNQSF